MNKLLVLLGLALLACAAIAVRADSSDMVQPMFLEAGETLEAYSSLDSEVAEEAESLLAQAEQETEEAFVEMNGAAETESDAETDAAVEAEVEGTAEQEMELEAEQAIQADADSETEGETEFDAENGQETEAESEAEAELDTDLLQLAAADDGEEEAAGGDDAAAGGDAAGGDAKPEHPTYVLPYPPVLPGHYTPLFNPYTNVNPLSTPFANYAAQPGAHPGVAASAAAQAGALAAVNGQIAGAQGAYPYYPYAAHAGVQAGLQGNPVPFSGYAGWIHPQNLNSAAVGENAGDEFPQFVEVAEAIVEQDACSNCHYN